MRTRRKLILGSLGGLLTSAALTVALGGAAPPPRGSAGQEAGGDPAVERARQQVEMLDALYKTTVVSITERYQRGQPAIMVAMDVFEAMEAGGHHSARLVDATGAPLGEDTDPKTDFEKRAAEAMRQNETYLDEVVGEGDERRLLAAAVVPAVHRRCAVCHGVEQGDLLGFISYEIPIR